jgi:hypothetical protein
MVSAMSRYAIVENGTVINVMLWDGDIDNWAPPDGQTAVEVPDGLPVTGGTKYIDGEFVLEVIEPIPELEPSAEDILRANTEARNALLAVAALAIAPLQDAADLGTETADEAALLKRWKQYRVTVNRVDLALNPPNWPAIPE